MEGHESIREKSNLEYDENNQYVLTPEDEEALLLEYGVSDVITDKLLPSLAAPSNFRSEYGTKDVFLTAETGHSHSFDNDSDCENDEYNNGNTTQNGRCQIADANCLTRDDALVSSLERLLVKYTSSYSYLSSEMLLKATRSALEDLQREHKCDKLNTTSKLTTLTNGEVEKEQKTEKGTILEKKKVENKFLNNNDTDNTSNNVHIKDDDILMQTNQLLEQANSLIYNKTTINEEHLFTNTLDDELSDLTYNMLWKMEGPEEEEIMTEELSLPMRKRKQLESEEKVMKLEERKEESSVDSANTKASVSTHRHELQTMEKINGNEETQDVNKDSVVSHTSVVEHINCEQNNQEIAELLTNAKQHIAKMKALCNESRKSFTETPCTSAQIAATNSEDNKNVDSVNLNMLDVNDNNACDMVKLERYKEHTDEKEMTSIEHITLCKTSNMASIDSEGHIIEESRKTTLTTNSNSEITHNGNKEWDTLENNWGNIFAERQSKLRSACAAQRTRITCYTDPYRLGEEKESNVGFDEISKGNDNASVTVRREQHELIMQSVQKVLEEEEEEEEEVQEECKGNNLLPKHVHVNKKITNKEEEQIAEKCHDAEGFAVLPSFKKRIDELIEPSLHERVALLAFSNEATLTSSLCTEREYKESQEKQQYMMNNSHQHFRSSPTQEGQKKEQSSLSSVQISRSRSVNLQKSTKSNQFQENGNNNNNSCNEHFPYSLLDNKNKEVKDDTIRLERMKVSWRVERELQEYHVLCKEDHKSYMRELQYEIQLAECHDNLEDCQREECDRRQAIVEHEKNMRSQIHNSVMLHKQLIINVMRAKHEEKVKLLISYLDMEYVTEHNKLMSCECAERQNLQSTATEEFNILYHAELAKRKAEQEERQRKAEEAERAYWMPQEVRKRTLDQEERILQEWFVAHSSNIQCTLDAIVEELAWHSAYKKKTTCTRNLPQVLSIKTTTDDNSITYANKQLETNSLSSRQLLDKLTKLITIDNKHNKYSLSEIRRLLYVLEVCALHIQRIDYNSVQHCTIHLESNTSSSSISINEITCASLVHELNVSNNNLENVSLVKLLRTFPSVRKLHLTDNRISSLNASHSEHHDDINSKDIFVDNCSLRSVKAVHNNAICEQTCVEMLDISHNQLSSVEEIATLLPLTLTCLVAEVNKITSLAPLVTCSRLQELHLAHNTIHSLNGLQSLRLLREIDVSYNCCSDDNTASTNDANNKSNERKQHTLKLQPLYNTCLLLQKLNISHNSLKSWNNVNKAQEESVVCKLSSLTEESERQQEKVKETLTEHTEQHECGYELNEKGILTSVTPAVFLFMTQMYIDYNSLTALAEADMPYLPMLSILHASHNNITSITGLSHCPRLIELDISHNALTSWKDLRPIISCQDLVNVNVLHNPCLDMSTKENVKLEAGHTNMEQNCNISIDRKIILQKHNDYYTNNNNNNGAVLSAKEVEKLLLQWLPKLERVNDNNAISTTTTTTTTNGSMEWNKFNNDHVTEIRTNKQLCFVTESLDTNDALSFHKSIYAVRAGLQEQANIHALQISVANEEEKLWHSRWEEANNDTNDRSNHEEDTETNKRYKCYEPPDPKYISKITQNANQSKLSILQHALQYWIHYYHHENDNESTRKIQNALCSSIHESVYTYKREQNAYSRLSVWLEKYICVWRAKKKLRELYQEREMKIQHAKYITALRLIQPVGRGAILRMRLRRVMTAQYNKKLHYCAGKVDQSKTNATHYAEYNKNNDNDYYDDDDDVHYVKINEELPQLSESISQENDNNIIHVLRKVNVKQIPVPLLPELQVIESASKSVLTKNCESEVNSDTSNIHVIERTNNEDSDPTAISNILLKEKATVTDDSRLELKAHIEVGTTISTTTSNNNNNNTTVENNKNEELQESRSRRSNEPEVNDESVYRAIVSAKLATKRKKMNKQHEQELKREFMLDPLKVKKLRDANDVK